MERSGGSRPPRSSTAALDAAVAGDEGYRLLEPGTYAGQLYRENLRQVTIRSADRANPALIEGGDYGLHLADPVGVTLSDLVFEKQLDNGINIDDAGSYETPARDIRLIRIAVKHIVNGGNHDAIKMAGVEDFLIDGAHIENWGDDGSAIDFVGCRNGLVQNSLLIHSALKVGGSGIRPKGGSQKSSSAPTASSSRSRQAAPSRRAARLTQNFFALLMATRTTRRTASRSRVMSLSVEARRSHG